MNSQKKQQLFPFLIMFKLNEQIGDGKTLQERSEVETEQLMGLAVQVKDSPELFDQMIETAVSFSDEDWSSLEQEYINYTNSKSTIPTDNTVDKTTINEEEMEEDQASITAKKGAKLQQLQAYRKGATVKKKKMCSCGCELVSKKEAGGKIVESCSCGCQMKKEQGGKISDKVKAIADKKLPKLKPTKK